jgi:ribonuclease VapC
MFVDASAMVAMMIGEIDAGELASRMQTAIMRRTSPIAVFETAAAASRILSIPIGDARVAVDDFLRLSSVRVFPIPAEAAVLALDAFARYGKGRGHPAQLNMGDCFAYACARHFDEPLLFKGSDFSRTDIESAMD